MAKQTLSGRPAAVLVAVLSADGQGIPGVEPVAGKGIYR
jgi:hypothetical protein